MLFLEKKSFTSRIFGSEMQKSTFFKKNVSTVQFYQIKVQTISYWSSRLTKHQTLEIWLLSALYALLKIAISKIFENRP